METRHGEEAPTGDEDLTFVWHDNCDQRVYALVIVVQQTEHSTLVAYGVSNVMGDASVEEKVTRVECTTTASPEIFTIEVFHSWSPNGAERFLDLVKDGYFTDVAFFRCVRGFLCQFGISPDPDSSKKHYWKDQGPITDDIRLGIPFKRGMLSFAGSGPNSRTTQLFITLRELSHLGTASAPWETPFGVVTTGMETVIDNLYMGYGDQLPFNKNGVNQGILQQRGNAYLREEFPLISYFQGCTVVGETNHPEIGNAIDNTEFDQVEESEWAYLDGRQAPPHKLPTMSEESSEYRPALVESESVRRSGGFYGACFFATMVLALWIWKKCEGCGTRNMWSKRRT